MYISVVTRYYLEEIMRKIVDNTTFIGFSIFVICLFFTISIVAAIEPGSAIGIWLLNEGDGNTINDSSGNENHGELMGGKWVDGPSGPALSLNGVNDRVIVPDSDSLYADKAWTITAWVNVNGAENGFGHIIGKEMILLQQLTMHSVQVAMELDGKHILDWAVGKVLGTKVM